VAAWSMDGTSLGHALGAAQPPSTNATSGATCASESRTCPMPWSALRASRWRGAWTAATGSCRAASRATPTLLQAPTTLLAHTV
jgi:hypothetical protein